MQTKTTFTHIIEDTLIALRVNLMLFVNRSGGLVFAKALDLERGEEVPVPHSIMKRLSADGLLLTHSNTESSIKGLILLDEGPMLIVSRPILMGGGPIRGTLIMGRYIDLEMLNPSPGMMRLTLQRLDGAHMSLDFQRTLSSFPQNGPIVVQKLNESTIAGYSLLRDVYGKPALVLRVEMPRDVYAQGKKSAFYLILALVVAFVSEKRVEMEKRDDLTARMSLSGNDELSQLADAINGMLAALENSQNELIDSEKRYRTLFNSTSDAVFVHGLTEDGMLGRFIEVNNVACETLGYTREELLGSRPRTSRRASTERTFPLRWRSCSQMSTCPLRAYS